MAKSTPRTAPGEFLDTDARWELVRHLLHDPDSASVEDRAAACLVLLYTQPVAKIAQLTSGDVDDDEYGNTFLALGSTSRPQRDG